MLSKSLTHKDYELYLETYSLSYPFWLSVILCSVCSATCDSLSYSQRNHACDCLPVTAECKYISLRESTPAYPWANAKLSVRFSVGVACCAKPQSAAVQSNGSHFKRPLWFEFSPEHPWLHEWDPFSRPDLTCRLEQDAGGVWTVCLYLRKSSINLPSADSALKATSITAPSQWQSFVRAEGSRVNT